jgi:hypothetical protein
MFGESFRLIQCNKENMTNYLDELINKWDEMSKKYTKEEDIEQADFAIELLQHLRKAITGRKLSIRR